MAVSVALLVAIAVVTLRVAGVHLGVTAVVAVARGAVQLALVSALLGLALTEVWAGAAMLLIMFGTATATATAARRLRDFPRAIVPVAVAISGGVVVTIAVVFGTGAFDLSLRYVLAFSGIVVGGSMTAAASTGRQLWLGMVHRSNEIEGWLALGATPRQAVEDIARLAVVEALRPAIDQTKTTGLVTLPGAFVGALLAGASPVEAGIFQVTVLAGLLAAGAVSATTTAFLLGEAKTLPAR